MMIQSDRSLTTAQSLQGAVTATAALTGREWIVRIAAALAEVEGSLRRPDSEAASGDEALAMPGRSLLPSPGVERRALALRFKRQRLLEEASNLRAELAALPADAPPDIARFMEPVRKLARALDLFEQEEIDLVQEAVTPDIGAGD